MQDALDDTKRQIDDLNNEKEKCERRQHNAGKLLELLTDEGKRWEENIKKLSADEVYFVGNVFVAAASLSYLGPFNGQFRSELVAKWMQHAAEK